jgi:type I restriction enzyme S subunit
MKETTDMEPVNSKIPTLSTIRTTEKYRIPNDWKVKRLEEICTTFKSGQGITSSDIFETGPYAVYGGNGLRGFTNRYTHDGDYILIGRQGALCGNITFISGQNYVSEHAIAVQTDSENDIAFFSYKLESLNLNRFSESSAQPGLSVEKLVRRKIFIPPIIEQCAIASLLSTWDEAIQLNTKLIAQKELSKKWLMQNLLTGNKRLKGFSEDWKYVKIKAVASEISIKNRGDKELVVLSCTKYNGLVPSLEYFGRKIYADDLTTYKIVPQNHFAYATNHIEEGSIGYQSNYNEALISPMYTVFQTDNSINDEFLFKLLKSFNYIHEYQKRMEGSIDRRGGLRWDEFSKIKIPLPSLEEQSAITQILQTSDNELLLLRDKLEMLKEQKKGLMQILLTGKKRLKIN